jgi:hypothetical protein
MENASNALLMTAGILIGVIILSIGAYLYSVFGNYGSDIAQSIVDTQIQEFNAKFTKYESYTTKQGNFNLCNIHDIVTIANLANKNNTDYNYYEENYQGPYYINVSIVNIGAKGKNLEKALDEDLTELIKEYSLDENQSAINFYCTVTINQDTKKVQTVTFRKV